MTKGASAALRLARGPMVLAWLLVGCEVRGVVGSNLDDGGANGATTDPSSPGSTPTTTASGPGGPADGTTGGVGPRSTSGDGGADTEADVVYDVGVPDAPAVCFDSPATSCDSLSDDPFRAMGLDCPGGHEEVAGSYTGDPAALIVHHGALGTQGYFSPREGDKMVILSTGRAEEIAWSPAMLCPDCPNTTFGGPVMTALPPPIDVRPVDEVLTCADDPSLIATGDCSNTLGDEWAAGTGAYDYAELRIEAEVPPGYDSLRYQFAFLSTEYPMWFDPASPFNDMYVAWLESEAWTGNISFDEAGNPISMNGVFLDFRDADAPGCAPPCVAPELAGFAMEGHAGTRWLETVAPVMEGETIELVFSIFDLTDGSFDSAVLLDGWRWTCSDGPPMTSPAP